MFPAQLRSPRSLFIPAKYSSASKQRIRNIYHHSLLAYYTVFKPGHIIAVMELCNKHMNFKTFSKTFKVIAQRKEGASQFQAPLGQIRK